MPIGNRAAMLMGMTQEINAPAGRGPVVDEGLPELMGVTEVAELYGVSRAAVKKMINAGRLPARRAGSTWVVRREVAEGLTVDGDMIEPPAEVPEAAARVAVARNRAACGGPE